MITPVIMAGGTGTRLWPLSRAGHPTQFRATNMDLINIDLTFNRLAGFNHPASSPPKLRAISKVLYV